MAMRSHRLISSAAAACLLGVLAFSVASAQDGQPERPPQQGQPEGRPGGGNRPGVGRGEAPNVEASMKGINRAIQQLRDQFNGAGEKEACLKLIGDAQRARGPSVCVGSGEVPLGEHDLAAAAADALGDERRGSGPVACTSVSCRDRDRLCVRSAVVPVCPAIRVG